MKKTLLFGLFTLGLLVPAPAGIYSVGAVNGGGSSLNLAIPDGQSPIGVSSAINVSGAGTTLTSVTVTLNISGGWNGDLYGYLSYNGTAVVLLNHVGTGSGDQIQNVAGFSTSGFNNITLANGGSAGDIHGVPSPVSGNSYAPDSNGNGNTLLSFNDMNPNGTWTLFLADNSQGNQSTLAGWSLDITAVPEPVDWALAIFGVVFIGAGVVRWYFNSKPA